MYSLFFLYKSISNWSCCWCSKAYSTRATVSFSVSSPYINPHLNAKRWFIYNSKFDNELSTSCKINFNSNGNFKMNLVHDDVVKTHPLFVLHYYHIWFGYLIITYKTYRIKGFIITIKTKTLGKYISLTQKKTYLIEENFCF